MFNLTLEEISSLKDKAVLKLLQNKSEAAVASAVAAVRAKNPTDPEIVALLKAIDAAVKIRETVSRNKKPSVVKRPRKNPTASAQTTPV